MAEPQTYQELQARFQRAPSDATREPINRINATILNAFQNASPADMAAFREAMHKLVVDAGGKHDKASYAKAFQVYLDGMRDALVRGGAIPNLPPLNPTELTSTQITTQQRQALLELRDRLSGEFVSTSGLQYTTDQLKRLIDAHRVPGVDPRIDKVLPSLGTLQRATDPINALVKFQTTGVDTGIRLADDQSLSTPRIVQARANEPGGRSDVC